MAINNDLTLSNVGARIKAPTPKFFKKLRLIGLIIGGVGAALLASPIALPAALLSAAGYLFTAGSVIAAVSQVTSTKDVSVSAQVPSPNTPQPPAQAQAPVNSPVQVSDSVNSN